MTDIKRFDLVKWNDGDKSMEADDEGYYVLYTDHIAALEAVKATVRIVPPHCSGTALGFDPGTLHVNKDGSGYIAINEDDFILEDDRREGPDGPEGSVHWIVRLGASEMIALRDFLVNGALAPSPALEAKTEGE